MSEQTANTGNENGETRRVTAGDTSLFLNALDVQGAQFWKTAIDQPRHHNWDIGSDKGEDGCEKIPAETIYMK